MEDSKSLIKELSVFFDCDALIKLEISEAFNSTLAAYKYIDGSIFSASQFMQNIHPDSFLQFFFSQTNLFNLDSSFNLTSFLETCHQSTTDGLCKFSKFEIFSSILLIFNLFLVDQGWGPSFLYIRETEKVDFQKRLSEATDDQFKQLQKVLDEKNVRSQISDYLASSGEKPTRGIKLILLFVIAYELLVNSSFFTDITVSTLWQTRLIFLRNKFLSVPILEMRELVTAGYDTFLNKLNETQKYLSALILVEKANCVLFYYCYSQAETAINTAQQLLNLKLNLTGRLGKRTKYQEEDIPVLVLEKESGTLNLNDEFTRKLDVKQPDFVALDENVANLEETKLKEGERITDTEVTVYDQIYVCSLLNLMKSENADEDVLREILLVYSKTIGRTSYDWLVYSLLLLLKSKAEDHKHRTIERVLMQVESLCNQHNDREPAPYTRCRFFFTINYPVIQELKADYAQIYMGFGAYLTAAKVFEEIEMYDKCVNSLYLAGKQDEALAFANKVLEEEEDPGIYCVLGEIKDDVTYFEKAVEVSGGKYAKAYRCLGRYYFVKKDFEKSILYNEKALAMNAFFPNVWFNLGYIYLQRNEHKEALRCFAKVVQIDNAQPDAWSNMGACFMETSQFKQATNCFEQGLKYSVNSGRIYENLLRAVVADRNLNKLLATMLKMSFSSHFDKIHAVFYLKVVEMYIEEYKELSEENKEIYKRKIEDLFRLYGEKDGLRAEIWNIQSSFAIFNETSWSKVVELKRKALRCLMVPNWVENENVLKKVRAEIGAIRSFAMKLSDEMERNATDEFLATVEQTIENEMEKNK